MIKIAHVNEVTLLNAIVPSEVINVVSGIAAILDDEYGPNRDIDGDLGGYILIIENSKDLDSLNDIYIDLKEVIPEYVDRISVTNNQDYTNSLILMNSDYSVSLIMPMSLTPEQLKNWMI